LSKSTPAAVDWVGLEEAAAEARTKAHAPYSGYAVGAALLTSSGRVFAACNVENASFGLSLCAERSAIAHMVAAGESDPLALVIVTQGPVAASPCGMCRQTLAEFASDLPIRLVAAEGGALPRVTSLAVLLPDAFRADTLKRP
jgi:cytidine deaminase